MDNLYSKKPVPEEHIQSLTTFASRAALAIENAAAYKEFWRKVRQLEETRDRLIRSERLAVMGNISAYVAHEIRNPLATIGGFARSILRASIRMIK